MVSTVGHNSLTTCIVKMASLGKDCGLEYASTDLHDWLQQALGNKGNCLDFEANDETVGVLKQIMENCKRDREDKMLLLEDFHSKALEYEAEVDRLNDILKVTGFDVGVLPGTVRLAISALAEIAAELELKDVSLTGCGLALSQLTLETAKASAELAREQRLGAEMDVKLMNTLKKKHRLQEEISTCKKWAREQDPCLQKCAQNGEFFRAKSQHYRSKISNLEKKLDPRVTNASLCHATLLRKCRKLKELEEQLRTKELTLRSLCLLPANEDLARVKIEEAKQELEQLHAQFEAMAVKKICN